MSTDPFWRTLKAPSSRASSGPAGLLDTTDRSRSQSEPPKTTSRPSAAAKSSALLPPTMLTSRGSIRVAVYSRSMSLLTESGSGEIVTKKACPWRPARSQNGSPQKPGAVLSSRPWRVRAEDPGGERLLSRLRNGTTGELCRRAPKSKTAVRLDSTFSYRDRWHALL